MAGFRDGRFEETSKITESLAERLLRVDVAAHEERVNRLVEIAIDQNAFDALVSFDFNTGGLARSTALRLLNAGNRRGAAEADLFLTPADHEEPPPSSPPSSMPRRRCLPSGRGQ